MHKDTPVYLFLSQKDWEDWLEKWDGEIQAIWVKIAKKNTGAVSVSYDQAVESALCYGWIDGLVNKYDEKYYIQRFTPRRVRSIWSQINRDHIARLIKEKRMKPAGLAAVEVAKKNGQWEAAYGSPSTTQVPDDFRQAVAKDPKILAFYNTLNKSNLYAIAWRLQTAKKPETRARRFAVLLEMLRKGEKLY